jgi:hypothetical protein
VRRGGGAGQGQAASLRLVFLWRRFSPAPSRRLILRRSFLTLFLALSPFLLDAKS